VDEDQRTVSAAPPGSFRIGSIGGVDVFVRASWLVIAALIAYLMAPAIEQVEPGLGALKYVAGVAFAVLLYLSVLLHEMSHALTARHFGLPVRSITLQFLGGMTEIEGEPHSPGQEFTVAVVGPLTSLAVGGAAWSALLLGPSGLVEMAIYGLAVSNLVVGVLNLVPGLPLDGGRVLRAGVWKATGNMHRGTIVAAWGGRVAAVLVLLWPFFAGNLLGYQVDVFDYAVACVIAVFLWSGAGASLVSARVRRRLPSLRARPLARRAVSVTEGTSVAEAVRQTQDAEAGGIVVVDRAGRPVGIVSEAALAQVPVDRRPWMLVQAVARTVEEGLVLPADIVGEDLVLAMSRHPASEYALVEDDGSLYGILSTLDVDRAFEAGARK
jgi:Zn-dependent protease/CBS domain-containing protein